jgi:CheY-like chemotaxis protein
MKNILFVDDERAVLSRLHRLHTKWNMEFVDSGALAIEQMQTRAYDVVVTDMRMPARPPGVLRFALALLQCGIASFLPLHEQTCLPLELCNSLACIRSNG